MSIQKAHKIEDVYNAVLDEALSISEIANFYCETDPARGPSSARFYLKTLIDQNSRSNRNAHILFVGYRGCGKSTELNHLQRDLEDTYAILNYSVMRELDPQSMNYIELFIVTMERLFNLIDEKGLTIDAAFLDRVKSWTQTKEIEDIKDKHFSAEVNAGIKAKIGIPYLKEFFFNLKGSAKTSNSFKETLKQTLEPRLADLVQYCNELISQVRVKLIGLGYKDLVIFIEDLDKIPLERAKDLFYNYANQLTLLKATVIYTFPVSLYYNNFFGPIRAYFSSVIELPMVKIFNKDGSDYDEGINILKEIIYARMDKTLFADEAILLKMIKKTGGVIRDLFAIINDAAFMAQFQNKQAIDEIGFTQGYNTLKKDYDNTIADYTENGTVKFKASEQYQIMADLVKNEKKKPDNSEIMMLLRQNLCVLSYNGEGWCDIHPAMRDILKDKGYLQ